MVVVNLGVPKTSKTYTIKIEENPYIGKKIGDEVSLEPLGIKGKAKITGGSTKEGFPMVPFLEVAGNKRVLLSNGIGFKARFKGEKKRRTVHGRIISDKIAQINMKLIKLDEEINLDEKFGKKEEGEKK